MGKVCNGSKLAYLVHISIIFDSLFEVWASGVWLLINLVTVNASRHEISRASRRLLNKPSLEVAHELSGVCYDR